jgi:hypothetical protein
MKIGSLKAALMMTLLAGTCVAQPNGLLGPSRGSPTPVDASAGVQLRISVTNTDIVVGSTIIIRAEITNASANAIGVHVTDAREDFEVYLTDNSGSVFKVSREPSGATYGASLPIPIAPGESHRWRISVAVRKEIEPGDYKLTVAKRVREGEAIVRVESNVLSVRVMQQ